MGQQGSAESEEEPDWRRRLFRACFALPSSLGVEENAPGVLLARFLACDVWTKIVFFFFAAVTKSKSKSLKIGATDEVPLLWSLWESSKFCVWSRLKTPLGGPVQVCPVTMLSRFKIFLEY
jgi:hypothetical protein